MQSDSIVAAKTLTDLTGSGSLDGTITLLNYGALGRPRVTDGDRSRKEPNMPEHERLDDYLKSRSDKFEYKKKLIIFGTILYRPTSERVLEGFRYFNCPISELLEPFQTGDFQAISRLPYALDDEGDPDTSSVLLDVAYTESGAMVAAQPVEYQNYNPTAVAPVLLLEGENARRVVELIKALKQNR